MYIDYHDPIKKYLTCKKCGYCWEPLSFNAGETNTTVELIGYREHQQVLRFKCGRCGHLWDEKPLDYEENSDE